MRYLCLLALFLLLPQSFVGADGSAFDQLSAVKTSFEFTLNNAPLEVSKQGITLRAVRAKTLHQAKSRDRQINDFAYRTYHLEFSLQKKYSLQNSFDRIEFFEGNDLIHEISLKENSQSIMVANGPLYKTTFFAISLEGLPLVILDATDRINLSRVK